MKSEIRRAIPQDAKELIQLSKRTISQSYKTFLGDAAVDGYIESGEIEQYIRNNHERCMIISVDGLPIGYSVIKDNFVDVLMINEDHQRQGLGEALLLHIEQMLYTSFEELELESFDKNEKANRFYQKHGWTVAKRIFDRNLGSYKLIFRKKRISD